MERKPIHHARVRRWLGAGCTLGLICVVASAGVSFAQASGSGGRASASSSSTSSKKTGSKAKPKTSSSKTSNPKTHAKTSVKKSTAKKSSAKTTASQQRAHPPSHLAAETEKLSTASTAKSGSSKKHGKRGKKVRGQQKIDPERAQAIQEALIREHYLSGAAAGTWNQASEDAMRRYQADHGWQSKTVPDSRALISLGLGPSQDHLLNPESAMTTGPQSTRAASLNPASQSSGPQTSAAQSPVSHSADPGTRMNVPATPAPASTSEHDAPQ